MLECWKICCVLSSGLLNYIFLKMYNAFFTLEYHNYLATFQFLNTWSFEDLCTLVSNWIFIGFVPGNNLWVLITFDSSLIEFKLWLLNFILVFELRVHRVFYAVINFFPASKTVVGTQMFCLKKIPTFFWYLMHCLSK